MADPKLQAKVILNKTVFILFVLVHGVSSVSQNIRVHGVSSVSHALLRLLEIFDQS